MSRQFEIEWPDFGLTVPVDLFDEENPELCEAFWQCLPFQTILAGSMSAGEMLKIPVLCPLPMTKSAKLGFFPEEPVGTIINIGMGSLLLKYGTVAEPFRSPRLGRVPEKALDSLREVAIKLRDAYFFTKEINVANLRRKE